MGKKVVKTPAAEAAAGEAVALAAAIAKQAGEQFFIVTTGGDVEVPQIVFGAVQNLESVIAGQAEKIAELEAALQEKLEAEAAADNSVLYESVNGKQYKITVPKFWFRGVNYEVADAVVNHTAVLETLIEAKASILIPVA